MNERWDIVIKPKDSLLKLNVKSILEYKDLMFLFVRRDFVSRYKQTMLGPIWFFIQPLLTSLMFYVVFAKIAKIPTNGLPPILFYMCGTTIWNYFSDCFSGTSNTFVANQGVFGKVYFPRIVVPISIVISNIYKFGFQFVLLIFFLAYYANMGVATIVQWNWIWILPILIIQMALLGLAMGLIFSALTTKYRDFQFLLSFGIQLLMYATPIIYPMSEISGKLESVILLNPLSGIIESFRFILTGTGTLRLEMLGVSWAVTFVFLFLGLVIFNHVEKSFIDTV